MQRILMLGTAAATAEKNYNTCFVLENDKEYLLVDTGCSNKILENLEKVHIELSDIHHIFISHKHMDHLLGVFWILRKISMLIRKNKYEGNLNIYCNEEVANIIPIFYKMLLRKSQADVIDSFINVVIVQDNESIQINGNQFTFFDTKANEVNLYGFETIINNKKLVFLGDEKCNPIFYDRISNADYVMHEVFCLEKDKQNSGAGAAVHSTLEEVSTKLSGLNIKNLILFHSKENNKIDKKLEFEKIGNELFDGTLIVPNDLEIIDIC